MALIDVITLFATMITLAALPSASVLLVITQAATLGVKNGIAVAIGIVLGDLVLMTLALLGLSVVAETMGIFFFLLKVMGGLYLMWLGLSVWRSKDDWVGTGHNNSIYKGGLVTSVLSGFVLTLGDVKAIFFYASLLPAFVEVSALRTRDLITLLAIIMVAVGGVKILYAILATGAARFLERRNLQNASRKIAGSLMIGAGGYLVLKT